MEFKVVFNFRADADGLEFLNNAKQIIEAAGFALETTVFAESNDN